jgi:4-amino-4-deoxy-L-arabinose transferase-like glycosyltransferase
MTTIAPPSAAHRAAGRPQAIRDRARLAAVQMTWVVPATAGVLLLAAALYLVNLAVSGYANVYYSGAAWAASQSWSAWFMGAIDPATFITVDKPPLSTMVMGLSVRLFGLSSASILVPEALMGVAAVGLLMAAVRRTFGAPASILAGLVMALTPAAVLIFRYNNPDALLTLLLVAAAWALIRAIERDRFRWLVLAGVLVGLAFNTKLLQAYLVVPAFAVTFALAAPGSIRRRAAGLAVGAVAVAISSAWWVAAMDVIPAASRAYVGGSTNNTVLDLILGYDGLGRIFGGDGNGGGGGGGFSGTPGLLRLFNSQLGGQVAWLLPMSLVGLGAGLVARLRAPRTDLARAGFVLWGLWLAVNALVFSFMSGVIHSYYTVMLAPAIGALTGGGLIVLWRARERVRLAGLALGLAILGSAGVAWLLLERTPSFVPGLGIAVVAVAVLVLPIVTLRPRPDRHRTQLAAAALGIAVLLAAPAAYAADTMATAYSGGDPSAGPAVADAGGPGGGGFARGAFAPPATNGGTVNALRPGAAFGGPGGASLDAAMREYLVANQGSARWIVAVPGGNSASELELETGRAVMAMGGFTGSDNAPTLQQLQTLVAAGELRFVAVGGEGGRPDAGSSSISAWVSSACTAVSVDGSSSAVYDCAGAVTG